MRTYVVRALEEIVGKESGVDLHQENSEIEKTLNLWLESAGITVGSRKYDVTPKMPITASMSATAPNDENRKITGLRSVSDSESSICF